MINLQLKHLSELNCKLYSILFINNGVIEYIEYKNILILMNYYNQSKLR